MVAPIPLDSLAEGLRISGAELVSLVGGGGKTTSLFALGRQLQGTTVLTTTTKMGADQSGPDPVLIDPTDADLMRSLDAAKRVLVWGDADGRRATGVAPERCDHWFATLSDNVVVEADGSRKRPFKAPATYEPVVPQRTTLLIACVGVDAIGRPIADACHRPEQVAALARCGVDDVLSVAAAAAVLLSPLGSQKGRPAGARFAVALHRVTSAHRGIIDELAERLSDSDADFVAVRSLT